MHTTWIWMHHPSKGQKKPFAHGAFLQLTLVYSRLFLLFPCSKRPKNDDRNTKRSGRAPVREGKRAYDRRSGTGRGKEIKKGGGGAHNWGSDKVDAKAVEHTQVGALAAEEQENVDAAAVNGEENTELEGEQEPGAAAEEQEPEPEPEDNTMSYEEYLASMKEKKSGLLAPVEERQVINEFGNVAPAKKVEEDFTGGAGGKSKRKKAAAGKEKEDASTDVAAELLAGLKVGGPDSGGRGRGRGRGGRGRGRSDGPDGPGDRGGRGRGRGERGGGRGGGRGRTTSGRGRGGGGRGSSSSGGRINVMDENAFPSL
jgi:plasminogen activator inhibitor 1 RNA-binding protein